MKKQIIMGAVIVAAVVMVMAGSVMAAGTTTSDVQATATVAAACQFGGTPTIDFGSGDANLGFGAATITPPTLWCTTGYTATVTDSSPNKSGGNFRLKNGTNYIIYNFSYTTAPVGAGVSTTNLMTLTASIPTANVASAPAGVYTDTVTLTINY